MESEPENTRPDDQLARRCLVMVATLVAIFALAHTIRHGFLDERPQIDLAIFLGAARAIDTGENPYLTVGEFGRNYHYPQSWAYLLIPLSRLDPDVAGRAWHAFSTFFFAGIIAIAVWWGVRKARPWPPSAPPLILAVTIAALLGPGFSAIHFGWRVGQIDLFLVFLMAMGLFLPWGWYLPYAAGIFVGFAVILKLSPIFLVPVLGLALGWRFAAAGLGVVAAYALWLLGMGMFERELFLFSDQLGFHRYRAGFYSCSLHYFFGVYLWGEHFIGPDGHYGSWLTRLISVVMLTGYAACGLALWWRRAGLLPLLTVGVAFSHLASPFLQAHHYTNILLVLIPWAVLTLRGRDWAGFGLVLLAWLPGAFILVFYEAFSGGWSPHILLFSDIALLALAFLRPNTGGALPWLLERDRIDRILGRERRPPHPCRDMTGGPPWKHQE